MRSKLFELYRALLAKTDRFPPDLVAKLGCPFLVCPSDNWSRSASRIMVVGQEPFEWGFRSGLHYEWNRPTLWSLDQALAHEDAVEALMDAYKAHMFEIQSPYPVRPYEAATKILNFQAAAQGRTDVVCTNLFLCTFQSEDLDSRSPLNASRQELREILT